MFFMMTHVNMKTADEEIIPGTTVCAVNAACSQQVLIGRLIRLLLCHVGVYEQRNRGIDER